MMTDPPFIDLIPVERAETLIAVMRSDYLHGLHFDFRTYGMPKDMAMRFYTRNREQIEKPDAAA